MTGGRCFLALLDRRPAISAPGTFLPWRGAVWRNGYHFLGFGAVQSASSKSFTLLLAFGVSRTVDISPRSQAIWDLLKQQPAMEPLPRSS